MSQELVENEDTLPAGQQSTANATANALGGLGGQAYNLTYVDNYSTLMLVYSFLSLLGSQAGQGANLSQAASELTPLLKSVMEEEKKYRQAFLDAVESLKK
ncbi:hypothetical protein ACTID9_11835 [Brevibacillus fluminis]|uniref:hypothetical protein n=1 Tax=Brevibacillus fluminis TaxID=511487 RepID=UPI003F88CE99